MEEGCSGLVRIVHKSCSVVSSALIYQSIRTSSPPPEGWSGGWSGTGGDGFARWQRGKGSYDKQPASRQCLGSASLRLLPIRAFSDSAFTLDKERGSYGAVRRHAIGSGPVRVTAHPRTLAHLLVLHGITLHCLDDESRKPSGSPTPTPGEPVCWDLVYLNDTHLASPVFGSHYL